MPKFAVVQTRSIPLLLGAAGALVVAALTRGSATSDALETDAAQRARVVSAADAADVADGDARRAAAPRATPAASRR